MAKITVTQILLIILAILILLWLINWYVTCQRNKNSVGSDLANNNNSNNPFNSNTNLNTKEQFANNGLQGSPSVEYGQQKTPFMLYYFYHPACVHCKHFEPVWNTTISKLNPNIITARAIDGTKPENDDLTFYYNLTGYPTVILVTPANDIEYSGERNPTDLYNFIISKISQYSSDNQSMTSN